MNVLFSRLEAAVLDWAEERNIGKPGQMTAQLGKFLEEAHEVQAAHDAHDIEAMKLELGDVMVTAILLAGTMRTNVASCLDQAYAKIKNRTGKTVNGVFVKDGDDAAVKAAHVFPEDLDSVVDEGGC